MREGMALGRGLAGVELGQEQPAITTQPVASMVRSGARSEAATTRPFSIQTSPTASRPAVGSTTRPP